MVVALFMIFMFIVFIISIILLSVSIPFLVIQIKKIRKKMAFSKIILCFSIIGVVFGICLFSIPSIYIIHLREGHLKSNSKNIKTNTTIKWQDDFGNNYFLFNNKEYRFFGVEGTQNSKSIEIEKPIANIIPKNYNIMRPLNILFGADPKETIYTIKNTDDGILTTGGENSIYFLLYCDVNILDEKKIFYSDLNNYLFYFSRQKFGDENNCQLIENKNYESIKEIYNYKGEEINIEDKEYNYINIFGISHDKLLHKYILEIIIDGNTLYRVKYRSSRDGVHVTILKDYQKDIILRLIN